MNFYKRYAEIAQKNGMEPCSQATSELLGVTKSSISSWNIKNKPPKGETLVTIADTFHVSTDYLLGRTEDPTDYAKQTIPPEKREKILALSMQKRDLAIVRLYNKLDAADRSKAYGVIQGLLLQDKYLDQDVLPDAAHARTDIEPTPDMISNDNDIMDSEDF